MSEPVIEARGLGVTYSYRRGFRRRRLTAVEDVTLSVSRGETLAIVGESGSGKSTLARALLRLERPSAGRILFEGRDITALPERELRPLRARMQMVFQDPYTSLNPARTVGRIIADAIAVHEGRGSDLDARVAEALSAVGLEPAHAARRPHAFSGGQRQRIGLARALAPGPALVVADEPVSALDVSVQAQIINLMADLQETRRLSYVFIAHDLGLVRQIASRVAVMYLGRIVETAPAEALYARPMHPYTDALLSVQPVPERRTDRRRVVLSGDLPSPLAPPPGCAFHTRCPVAQPVCQRVRPPLIDHGQGRHLACHFPLNADTAAAERARAGSAEEKKEVT